MTYLDWASTSPPDSGILAEAARVAADSFGNPSSRHALGTAARDRLEEARSRLAAAIFGPGVDGPSATAGASRAPGRLAFTSGGTEADSIPLLALLRAALNARRDGSIKRLHLVASEIEHAAVYEEALLLKSLGIGVSFVAPEADGRVDPGKIGAAVEKDSALVAVMAVNNETGAVQPVAEIAQAIARAASAFGRAPPRLHVDAVQALGKIGFDSRAAGAGSAAFSAHKLRGPRGTGALWVAGEAGGASGLEPLALGGGQEGALRPGTESLQGAWAFAAAAAAARDNFAQRAALARNLEERLLVGLSSIPGALALPLGRQARDERYSPYILSVAFPGLAGEVLARSLSDSGIAVSTGSACSSNSKRAGRRILRAMGLPDDLAGSAIRVSTGDGSTEADIDAFLEAAAEAYRRLKT
jgi:cysteine desulfurase